MLEKILEVEVSPYYMRKMRTFFNCKSHHTKGVLTRTDYEMEADRYHKLANLSTLREQQARRKLLAIWDDYGEKMSQATPITPEVFAKCIVFRGKEQIIASATHYGDLIFDLIDVNADGKIKFEEFALFHKLFLLNEETADAAFNQLDKENKGYVNYDNFMVAFISYFHPEDETDTVLWGPLVD